MWVIIDGSIRAIYIYYIYVTCVTNHLQSPRNRRRVDSRPAATFAQRRLAVPKTRSVGWLGCKLSSCPLLCLPTGCSVLCHLWLMCRACDTSAGDFSPPLTRESWKLLGGLEIVNLHFFLPYTQVIAFFFPRLICFHREIMTNHQIEGYPLSRPCLGSRVTPIRGQEETASERHRQCGRAGDEPARSSAVGGSFWPKMGSYQAKNAMMGWVVRKNPKNGLSLINLINPYKIKQLG